MKQLSTLVALSALVMSGCMEESDPPTATETNVQSETQTTNPFEPTTTPSTPSVPADDPVEAQPPLTGPPVTEPPVAAGPTVQPPVTPQPDSGVVDVNRLVNGPTAATANSYWSCLDVGFDDIIDIGFYSDGTGSLKLGDELEVISWTANGPYIDINIGGQFFTQLDNVVISRPVPDLSASYVLADGTMGSLDCELIDADDSSQGGGPTPSGVPSAPTDNQGSLVNVDSTGELTSIWSCLLADGSALFLAFAAGGDGALGSDTYPDAIGMSWSETSQGVALSLFDGNQVTFTTPQFSSVDYFQVDQITINGWSVPGMACERLFL